VWLRLNSSVGSRCGAASQGLPLALHAGQLRQHAAQQQTREQKAAAISRLQKALPAQLLFLTQPARSLQGEVGGHGGGLRQHIHLRTTGGRQRERGSEPLGHQGPVNPCRVNCSADTLVSFSRTLV
jgi:hypothetical protein